MPSRMSGKQQSVLIKSEGLSLWRQPSRAASPSPPRSDDELWHRLSSESHTENYPDPNATI